MHSILIRPIRPEDNIPVAAIIRKVLTEFGANRAGTVFTDPATDDLFHLFQTAAAHYFVATREDLIVGGGGIFPTPALPAGYCELVKLYLLPEARGVGLGRHLMEACFEKARALGFKKIYLETMPELRGALRMYEKAGFTHLPGPLGESGHYGCDLWMIRDL